MGTFEDIKFHIITKKAKISEKEEDFLGRKIVKSSTPVKTFLSVPKHLRSTILCELAYLRSANAEERMIVANNTPVSCVKELTVPSLMLKMVRRDYTLYDKLNFELLRKPENREYALKIKLRYYEEVSTRQKSLAWACKQTDSESMREELAVLNGRMSLIEEEDIVGYATELRGIIDAREAEKRERDEFATKRAEEILAIGEEVRREREAKATTSTKKGNQDGSSKPTKPTKPNGYIGADEDEAQNYLP